MIDLDVACLKARATAYAKRTEPARVEAADGAAPALVSVARWRPVPADIEAPDALFAYLSPEVRRFAIAMETGLREPDGAGLSTQALRTSAEHRALRTQEHERPVILYRRLLVHASHLMEAVSHPNVTDPFQRPLGAEHIDRNPRRVADVLWEAARVACQCLRIADVCQALGASDE
jgi:hypothetical protein